MLHSIEAGHQEVESGDSQEGQSNDEHSGDISAFDSYVKSLIDSELRRLGRPHIRPHRYVHSDISGDCRKERSQKEGECSEEPELRDCPNDKEKDDSNDCYRLILAIQECFRSFLDSRSDLPHLLVSGRKFEDLSDKDRSMHDCDQRSSEDEQEDSGMK